MAKADPTSPKRIGGLVTAALSALKTALAARCGNSSSRCSPLFPVAWSDLSLPIGSVAGGTRRIHDQ
jgi:hypothetical protein